MRPRRLCIRFVNSIVPDMGIGHGHDLAFVRGIGQDLLIPCHAGVKNYLTNNLAVSTKGCSFEYCPVCKYKDCLFPDHLTSLHGVRKPRLSIGGTSCPVYFEMKTTFPPTIV